MRMKKEHKHHDIAFVECGGSSCSLLHGSCSFSWPHGDGLLMAGLFFTDYPPSWEKIPPVEDPGLCDPLGEPGWLSW